MIHKSLNHGLLCLGCAGDVKIPGNKKTSSGSGRGFNLVNEWLSLYSNSSG